MFKVLVIAYYFPPMGLSGVQRTLKFVKYLKNYNWEPTVLQPEMLPILLTMIIFIKEIERAKIKVIRDRMHLIPMLC